MVYYNCQRDRVTVSADVGALLKTKKKSQKKFKKVLTNKKKGGIIKSSRGACGCSASIKEIKITQRSMSWKLPRWERIPKKLPKKLLKNT